MVWRVYYLNCLVLRFFRELGCLTAAIGRVKPTWQVCAKWSKGRFVPYPFVVLSSFAIVDNLSSLNQARSKRIELCVHVLRYSICGCARMWFGQSTGHVKILLLSFVTVRRLSTSWIQTKIISESYSVSFRIELPFARWFLSILHICSASHYWLCLSQQWFNCVAFHLTMFFFVLHSTISVYSWNAPKQWLRYELSYKY